MTLHSSTGRGEPSQRTRRNIVAGGIKLAFVAPVLTTFFASDARAAVSGNQSCYPTGTACVDGGPNMEPCCDGACNFGVCP